MYDRPEWPRCLRGCTAIAKSWTCSWVCRMTLYLRVVSRCSLHALAGLVDDRVDVGNSLVCLGTVWMSA